MQVTYLEHSGFAVRTEKHLLIFDYYRDKPKGAGLSKGVIDPAEIKDLDVVVFASHSHGDHFNPCIFTWRKEVERIRYVLADEIQTAEDAFFIGGGQTLDLGDLQVRALESTDLGVAFVVQVDGHIIYHAGDLHWWHWEGEDEQENREMGRRYREQIDLLKGESIDLAFVPVDLRLEEQFLWGLDYFMKTVGAAHVVPMHFWRRFEVFEKIASQRPEYAEYICEFHRRGEQWTVSERG